MIENLYAIVAMTEKTNAIGKAGDMLYHLKDDLKYLKSTTENNTIVCGRKTYFSFPKRPLPNRKNIVLTRGNTVFDGAYTMHSREEIIEYAKNNPDEKIFICGGDKIYKQFMDDVSKLYVTSIVEEKKVDADSFFPEILEEKWKLTSESEYICPDNAPKYKFLIYDRI